MIYYAYIGSVSSFIEFGGETSKNVHDVQKCCLERTFFIYARFVEFYVFILVEINVIGSSI